jgi:3' exoribonuclease, RNase T-like
MLNKNVMVDVESDGPAPGLYSMVCFGAVYCDEYLQKTFYAEIKPISEDWIPEALAISGFTREQHLLFPDPLIAMTDFEKWLATLMEGRPIFWSDNNGYDFAFINYYFHRYLKRNPFGWSSANLGSFYKGLSKDTYKNFKHLRETKHTHNPVDDAIGNAEALIKMYKMIRNKSVY